MDLAPPLARTNRNPAVQPVRDDATPARPPRRGGYPVVKGVLDRLVAGCLLLAAAPVILAGWVLVRLTSNGPGFYSQVRVGSGGRTFRIFKLRSMYHNIEATAGGVRWSTKGDPRVTPVGRWLRKLHVDELPQLWNVLAGEMSMVGPRPERPELVSLLAEQVPGYRDRLLVPAGLTGLAQIQLPADSDLDSVRRKLVLDKCYVERAGVWFDVRLMAATAGYLLGLRAATLRRLFRLPDPTFTTDTLLDISI